jgi:hypothetical protein
MSNEANTKVQFSEREIFETTIKLVRAKHLVIGNIRLFPYAAIFDHADPKTVPNMVVGRA